MLQAEIWKNKSRGSEAELGTWRNGKVVVTGEWQVRGKVVLDDSERWAASKPCEGSQAIVTSFNYIPSAMVCLQSFKHFRKYIGWRVVSGL